MEGSASVRASLLRHLERNRVHSAYLLAGPEPAPREEALWFARALACESPGSEGPCEACGSCRRSTGRDEIALDGTGKRGPLLRHVGDHPDLLFVGRGADDTRVRIGQVRALQGELRLRIHGSGRRVVIVADAEWLNAEAQNALLRILEEPPTRTTLVLCTNSAAALLPTVRSRCQRFVFPPLPRVSPHDPSAPEETRALAEELDGLAGLGMPEILDWAERYRGGRAVAADAVGELLGVASAWLREQVGDEVDRDVPAMLAIDARLRAFRELAECRKALVQRNANPQMMAERALIALREAVSR